MTEHVFLPGVGKTDRPDFHSIGMLYPGRGLLPGRRLCLRCLCYPFVAVLPIPVGRLLHLIEEIEDILCIGKTSHQLRNVLSDL